ncbi:MAG: RNA polymerase sigma factor [Phycisphaeraceae bacterium]|nr:RNA polymerase sigma factor [Phycisphaerales bacterium]MCB9843771.1 RNA polymerase sigma factor [Phycisphaeraceae bacterium]
MAEAYVRTDEELVEDVLDGDVAAFRGLIERHHDALFRFLFRLTGNRQMAEDVFQDAFLQVHQSLDTFDSSRRFKPWLFTIAANKGRDALRKANRRKTVSLSAPVVEEGGKSFVDLMEIDLPDVSSPMEEAERSAKVQRAIDELSPRLREILLMAYFQKMTYAQIAELFGIPIGTVKSRLHSAVAAFAKAWQELNEKKSENDHAAESSG